MTSPKKPASTKHDLTVHLNSVNRDVLVSVDVPKGQSVKEWFNEAASFVQGLDARNQIADPEQGINPPGATHAVVKDGANYRLQRTRFSGGIAG